MCKGNIYKGFGLIETFDPSCDISQSIPKSKYIDIGMYRLHPSALRDSCPESPIGITRRQNSVILMIILITLASLDTCFDNRNCLAA